MGRGENGERERVAAQGSGGEGGLGRIEKGDGGQRKREERMGRANLTHEEF